MRVTADMIRPYEELLLVVGFPDHERLLAAVADAIGLPGHGTTRGQDIAASVFAALGRDDYWEDASRSEQRACAQTAAFISQQIAQALLAAPHGPATLADTLAVPRDPYSM